ELVDPHSGRVGVGILRHRRLRAIQRAGDRVCAAARRGDGVDGADVSGIPSDDGVDPAHSAACLNSWMAVGVPGVGDRSRARNRGDSAAGAVQAQSRVGVTRSQRTALACVAILALSTVLLLAVTGFDVSRALGALVRGSVGSLYAFGSGTLVR